MPHSPQITDEPFPGREPLLLRASNHVAALPDKYLNADDTLHRSVLLQHSNLTVSEFRPRLGIIDRALFRAITGPVRLNARTLVTLPSSFKWPNFDSYHALLYGLRLIGDLSFHVEGVEAWAVWPAASQRAVASLPLSN